MPASSRARAPLSRRLAPVLRHALLVPLFLFAICAAPAATLTVNTVVDEINTPSGKILSLREAIRDADPGDTIVFDAALDGRRLVIGTFSLNELVIDKSLAIDASSLRSGLVLEGVSTVRPIIDVRSGSVAIAGIEFVTGKPLIANAATLSMARCRFLEGRPAIVNMGALDVEDSYFNRNRVVSLAGGGAIYNAASGTLEVDRSSFFDNFGNTGAAFYNAAGGEMTLRNSTLYGNRSTGAGSGGAIVNLGSATLAFCTVVENTAQGRGAGITSPAGATLTLGNSIVAGNTGLGGDFDLDVESGTGLNLEAANFVGNNASVEAALPAGAPNANGDFAGTPVSALDPRLGPFGSYGGAALCLHPLPGSPAIDAAFPSRNLPGPSQPGDQRGFPRSVEGNHPPGGRIASDLGAVEAGPVLVVDEVADENGPAGPGPRDLSLREAIGLATEPGTRIFFDPAVFDNEAPDTIILSGGGINLVNRSVFIDASTLPCGLVTVAGRGFFVGASSSLALHQVAIADAAFPLNNRGGLVMIKSAVTQCGAVSGGGLTNSGNAVLEETSISGNFALMSGAGVYNEGELTLRRSSVHLNGMGRGHFPAINGGGICNSGEGSLLIVDSNIHRNVADNGGGIYLSGGGRTQFDRSTVHANEAGYGGGVFLEEGAQGNEPALIVDTCTIARNHASHEGGGIWAGSPFNLVDSTIASNSAESAGGGVKMAPSASAVAGASIAAQNVSGPANAPVADDFTGDVRLASRSIVVAHSGGTLVNPQNRLTDDPLLAPLGNYGGPTPTMLPLDSSPAVDASSFPRFLQKPDQRGVSRPQGPAHDLGAVEAVPAGPLVDTDHDSMDDRLEPLFGMVVGEDDGHLDADNDGSPNAAELANRTSPRDGADRLQILDISHGRGYDSKTNRVFDITWKAFPGLSYTIECDEFVDFASPLILGPFTATGFTETRSILFTSPATPAEFIRVRRD